MSRKRHEVDVEPIASDSPAPPVVAPPKRDYRFHVRGDLFGKQFIVIQGVAGDEAEARAELHRWVDASIVDIEASPIRTDRSLSAVENGAAFFTDGFKLEIPDAAAVRMDAPGHWIVQFAETSKVWRIGMSWHRVRQEIEQLRCAVEREARKEKPKLFAAGVP